MMKTKPVRNPARGLAALRRLTAKRPAVERCELCATVVPEQHEHLVETKSRRLLCACQACAILFDQTAVTPYRRVPRDSRILTDLSISDGFWNSLAIPTGLVFLLRSSVSESVLAVYPSPAGPTEVAIDAESWQELASLHPALAEMKPDVEALLANRIRDSREYFIAPVDECYRLTGLIRQHWRGFSGGDDAWLEIEAFFERLKQRSRPERIARHA